MILLRAEEELTRSQKFGAYVVWDQDEAIQEAEPSRRKATRRCTLCDTQCYRARGKLKGDAAAGETWVEVHLQSGVLVSCPFRPIVLPRMC